MPTSAMERMDSVDGGFSAFDRLFNLTSR
jgi:hypothetical protein